MKEGWTYKKLGEVATYINGYAFKPSEWVETGMPIIRIQNLNNPTAPYNYYDGEIPAKYEVEYGDILISWSASLGAYEWKREKALLNQHIFKVVFDKLNINKYFLKYAVEGKINDMLKDVHGATMKHIVKKDFDNTIIPYPSIDVQQQIVSELDLLGSVIEKQKAQIEELDKLAQSIFYDMFGDPVENEKGWGVKKLEDITSKIGSGATPRGGNQSYKDEGISLIRSLNVHNNAFIFSDLAYIDDEQAKSLNNVKVEKDDVLLNITGASVARCCIVPNIVLPARVNQHVCILRAKKDMVNHIYLNRYLTSKEEQAELLSLSKAKAATREALPKSTVDKILVSLPPLSLQQEFANKIQAIESMKAKVRQSLKESETLFNSRMDFYFS